MSFIFKINQRSVDNLEKSVRDAFNKAIRSKAMLTEIGDEIVTDIKDQTQNKAKSIPLQSRLKSLSKAWVKRRARLAEFNDTDPAYQATKSNLTFTGQLLNSLKHKILGVGKLEVFFDGTHQPYKGVKGKNLGKPISNEDLAGYVAENGRPFVGIRPLMQRKITRIVRTYVRRALNVAKLLKQNIDN